MESEAETEKRICTCNLTTTVWIKSLYLTQGIILTAVGFVGLSACTSSDVECARLRERYILVLLFACFHLISSAVCCLCCKNENANCRTLVAMILWSCVISGLVTFQALQLYQYKQAIILHVFYSIIMTAVLYVLIIVVCCLYVWELCKRGEKSNKLLLD